VCVCGGRGGVLVASIAFWGRDEMDDYFEGAGHFSLPNYCKRLGVVQEGVTTEN
jgi:hypothetical protein